MSNYTFEGKTLEEATKRAEEELGASRDDMKIELLEEKDKGVLGLSWGKKCVISVELAGGKLQRKGEEPHLVLEELLRQSGLEGSVESKETFDEIILDVKISERDESLFIGRRGKNLDAYQYLVSKISDNRNEKTKRVVVDCADYRSRRKAKLESMARKAAHIVKSEKKNYSFPPMQAGERKIIHMTIKEEGLQTESRGVGEEKKVVVFAPGNP